MNVLSWNGPLRRVCVCLLCAVGLMTSQVVWADEKSDAESAETKDNKDDAAKEADAIGEYKFERHVWRYQNASYVRLNPIGLINTSQAGYRYMLYDTDKLILKDSYVSLAFAPSFSPSFTSLGGLVEIKPAAVLVLSAKYEWVDYFGTFGTITSANSPSASHSDTDRNDARDLDENYATTGSILTLGALLQAKVGDVAVRTNGKMFRYDMNVTSGDTVLYDLTPDTLIGADGGTVFTLDTDVLYLVDKLTIGLRHTMVKPQYNDSDFQPGESTEHDNGHMRIGPLIAYRLSDNPDPTASFRQPTLFSLINWYIDHRHRTGDDVSQIVPYVVVGFAFNGRL